MNIPALWHPDFPLASKTTLELGGKAQFYAEAYDIPQLLSFITAARELKIPIKILGTGSNVIISDHGVRALVIGMCIKGVEYEHISENDLNLIVHAGEDWDALVNSVTSIGWAGLECLSGIPGLVGASPIQNIGAYGQEAADTISQVQVVEVETGMLQWLSAQDCQFGYRTSLFKKQPGRYIVVSVKFTLHKQRQPSLKYQELSHALSALPNPSVIQIREAVLKLRKNKSMIFDRTDENHRSVGSFFLNPIVPLSTAEKVKALAVEKKMVLSKEEVPCYAAPEGQQKLSAAWLIEKAGIVKGYKKGHVGVSSKHSLCLVHHGGGTTKELLDLASDIQQKVKAIFGVELEREPVLWE